ncbi:hypothetical protein BN2537_1359 [Streptomyces venezuelae]|nr:hypothetical protein BN2537_1359 [Streptomyces venezuelae]
MTRARRARGVLRSMGPLRTSRIGGVRMIVRRAREDHCP